jgi:hypothetical protein
MHACAHDANDADVYLLRLGWMMTVASSREVPLKMMKDAPCTGTSHETALSKRPNVAGMVLLVEGLRPYCMHAQHAQGRIGLGRRGPDQAACARMCAQVLDTLAEIEERGEAVRELEKSLLDLHQIFLDMAVLVEAQGEMLDNIEAQARVRCLCWLPRFQLRLFWLCFLPHDSDFASGATDMLSVIPGVHPASPRSLPCGAIIPWALHGTSESALVVCTFCELLCFRQCFLSGAQLL